MINLYDYYSNSTELDNSEYKDSLHIACTILQRYVEPDERKQLESVIHIIKRSANTSLLYAMYVVEGRWYEAEPTIMKDPLCAYGYAKFIIKGRWLEAEPYIKENDWCWKDYCRVFKIVIEE